MTALKNLKSSKSITPINTKVLHHTICKLCETSIELPYGMWYMVRDNTMVYVCDVCRADLTECEEE